MDLKDPIVGTAVLWFFGYLLLLIFLRMRPAGRWRVAAIIASIAVLLGPPALIILYALTCGNPGCGIVTIAVLPYLLVVLPILGGIAFFVFDMRPDRWKRGD